MRIAKQQGGDLHSNFLSSTIRPDVHSRTISILGTGLIPADADVEAVVP